MTLNGLIVSPLVPEKENGGSFSSLFFITEFIDTDTYLTTLI